VGRIISEWDELFRSELFPRIYISEWEELFLTIISEWEELFLSSGKNDFRTMPLFLRIIS
jgi:hypothetical protein